MKPNLLRIVAGSKLAACIGVGCGGTLGVQHYMTSSSSSWDEKAATEKESFGKGMKFEINQLSKQLEEKEQSLKALEELLTKKEADFKEQQAASVQTQTAHATTVVQTTNVADPKPEQAFIDEVPFGEEGRSPESQKLRMLRAGGIAKKEADEVPTSDVPKRPAVFDGGGAPAVVFPSTADVVTIKETSDIQEVLEAKLRARDRALEVLRERLELEEADLKEEDRQLAKLNTLNEDLKRELEETKGKFLRLEQESSISLACLRGGEWEDPEKRSEYLKDWLSQKGMLPKEGSFAVCRLKPKKASSSWL